jgi:outer membrane lipoprotein carrier protein
VKRLGTALRILAIDFVRRCAISAALMVIAGGAGAAMKPGSAPDLDVLLTRLQHHYQATKSFSARFTETVTRQGAPPVQRTGTICYQKPGKLRWEFDTPQPETIVSDGKTIYDYDPELDQVVETPLAQAFKNQAAAAFLLGAGNLKRDFIAAPPSQSLADGLTHVELVPKNAGQRIDAGIDTSTYNITSLAIHDPMGGETVLKFSNIELNQSQKASLFEFTPPSGADIVSSQGPR